MQEVTGRRVQPSASLCEASLLMVARPVAFHTPNKDDIYHTPINEKLVTEEIQTIATPSSNEHDLL